MPTHQAAFDPIPPDLDLHALVEKTANFSWVDRMSLDEIYEMGIFEFEKLVTVQVIIGGRPLIIGGWEKYLPPWMFGDKWLIENIGKKR